MLGDAFIHIDGLETSSIESSLYHHIETCGAEYSPLRISINSIFMSSPGPLRVVPSELIASIK